jgi:hypothetical protein
MKKKKKRIFPQKKFELIMKTNRREKKNLIILKII